MGSTTGAARAQFLYDKKIFKFNSLQESIAINIFNAHRNKELLAPIFSVVDPTKADKLLRQYRGVLFPEERWDDLKYMKKAQNAFKKLRNLVLKILPVGK
jgi:hypothetical protein